MIYRIFKNLKFKPYFHQNVNSNIKLQLHTQKLYKSSSATSNSLDLKEEWTTIYRLPLIRLVAAFNKIKIYQSAITMIGSPILYYAELMNQLPENFTLVFVSLGLTGSLTLILTSFLTTNVIGIIYIKKDTNKVKLAYVDYWGNRKHLELSIDDIVPADETPKPKWDLYQLVKTNVNAQNFKMLQRLGIVLDKERFIYIFGE